MKFLFLSLTSLVCLGGCTQNNHRIFTGNKPIAGDLKVGASCEGCEAVYECPLDFSQLNETDTLPGFNDPGPKIEISGVVYHRDGKTPAKDVILYIYHTDQKGLYSARADATSWEKRHGSSRGWIKTDANGYYRFFTLVPASYPNSKNPRHIHPTIKEPGKTAYWIEEFLFDNDPLLPEAERTKKNPVCGSGILKPVEENGMLRAKRDIILGLNVKDYPVN